MSSAKQFVTELMDMADIKEGGKRPQDITIHDDRWYVRTMRHGILGLGESYMDGWWDSNDLYASFSAAINARIEERLKPSAKMVMAGVEASLMNRQTKSKARRNAEHHYNIGNDLYELMLDRRMVYSCGYWKNTKSLDKAQEQKLDLICKKLGLKKDMTVLDIGCGWGAFLEYAARNYGIKGVGVTPAGEQVKLARERLKGLNVKILQRDYRDVSGKFDRIVSVGSFEHIGYKNYRTFFEICDEHLKPGGMMLHHTIGGNVDGVKADPWIEKYIFPGGNIPGLGQIVKAIEGRFMIEDLHNFGPDYAKTLLAWHKNFVKQYPKIKDRYDERFYRMWEFYLLMCAAGFHERNMHLWQIVMRRQEPSDTYQGIR